MYRLRRHFTRPRVLAAGLAAALALGACAGGEPEPASGTPIARADARLVEAPEPVVELTVNLRRPGQAVTKAVLVAPDGTRTPATRYDRTEMPDGTAESPRVGVVVGSRTGVRLSVPIQGSRAGQGGDLVVARIPVPDIDAYRASRDDWRIEITAADARGEPVTTEIAAP